MANKTEVRKESSLKECQVKQKDDTNWWKMPTEEDRQISLGKDQLYTVQTDWNGQSIPDSYTSNSPNPVSLPLTPMQNLPNNDVFQFTFKSGLICKTQQLNLQQGSLLNTGIPAELRFGTTYLLKCQKKLILLPGSPN